MHADARETTGVARKYKRITVSSFVGASRRAPLVRLADFNRENNLADLAIAETREREERKFRPDLTVDSKRGLLLSIGARARRLMFIHERAVDGEPDLPLSRKTWCTGGGGKR